MDGRKRPDGCTGVQRATPDRHAVTRLVQRTVTAHHGDSIPAASGFPPLMSDRRRIPFDWSTAAITALMVTAAATVLVRDGSAHFLAILRSDLGIFVGILPKMLAGCLIGGFVILLLPREVVVRWVGAESGILGILVASLIGVVLPGGPFTIYPIAGAFLAIGADAGAAIAFVTSWTLLGINRAVIWELPFFGVDFVTWRIVLSIPLPFLAGLMARLTIKTMAHHRGAA
jgi:uncharacterized membrane protein YraQ (UPF0718 family)